jgi:HEAT repeat protein
MCIQITPADMEFIRHCSCAEGMAFVRARWPLLRLGDKVFLATTLAQNQCRDITPYLLELLDSTRADYRERAVRGLKDLNRKDCRHLFIEFYHNDPDEEVRKEALIDLSAVFRTERDIEILQLALDAFDSPESSVGMRCYAAGALMHQLGTQELMGEPDWFDEEEEALHHPSVVWSVAEARRTLAEHESD